MTEVDKRRVEEQRSARRARAAAARQRARRRTTIWVALIALVVVLVAGAATAVRAVMAPKLQPTAQQTTPQPAVEATAEPVPVEAPAEETPAAPVEAVATEPDPASASKQAVPVLMYHHIMPEPDNSIAITPATFDAQMKYLKDNGFHPVTIKEFNAFIERGEQLPDKPVLITFDDNRMNQLEYGVPILKKYGFPATFFVVRKWVEADSDSFMHEKELKQLIADGFDVESHTSNHIQIHPSKLKSTGKMESYESFKKRYWEPTEGMRTWMDETFGGQVSALAYPGGRYQDEAEKLMGEAGYTTAFTTNDGYVTYKGQGSFALPRWNTGAKGTTMSRFATIMQGAETYKPKKSEN